MSYYPVSLNLEGRSCVVVGGGKVAERKAKGLLACGAVVRVVSPELTKPLATLCKEKVLIWTKRKYREGDLAKAFLVIAATDDLEVQRRTYEEAERRGILINVADVPQKCNFILPATVRRGDFTISVSTAGKSPALAKYLRRELEKRFGPEYKILIDILGVLRRGVLDKGQAQADNEPLFTRLVHEEMPTWIKDEKWDRVARHIRSVLGEDVNLDWLKGIGTRQDAETVTLFKQNRLMEDF